MTNWRSIEHDAPKDGRPVLLCARINRYPAGHHEKYLVVGFWHRPIERWRVWPELLNQIDDLNPSHWMPLPEQPAAEEVSQ